jgi:hypothetical protein
MTRDEIDARLRELDADIGDLYAERLTWGPYDPEARAAISERLHKLQREEVRLMQARAELELSMLDVLKALCAEAERLARRLRDERGSNE